MRKTKFLILICIILALYSCQKKSPTETPPDNNIHPQQDIPWPSLADSPWPSPHGNVQCNGRSKYIGPREGIVAWIFTDERFVNENSGVVLGSDGTIYFTAGKNSRVMKRYLYALKPVGSLKWKKEIEGKFASTPILGTGDIIYVPTYFGPIYAFNPDGTLKWKYGTSMYCSHTFSPVIGLDGSIYFADNYGNWHAINADGTLKWMNEEKANSSEILPYSYSLVMSPDGAVIYGGGLDATLNAFDAQTGTILWEVPTGRNLIASPLVDSNGNIYFFQFDSTGYHICSINSEGKLRWKGNHKLNWWISFHMDKDGNIYAYSEDQRILSFDYEGNLRWSSSTLGEVWPSSIIGDSEGVIFFAHTDTYVIALDQEGHTIFKCSLPDLSDGLFMGALSSDGHLYLSGKYQFFCIK
ncbi:PQQ-like beta-propeller repeat protein [candidate division KSB1 bacterium]|nr:PQQ-like beta-propeller repeat protein [candidate division KSB1 bacterium]MBL7094267.1 PQQ-like beta-propeller repeat protein [candidate division KSB1 bacterium]